jgi:signal transduction histidine kinase
VNPAPGEPEPAGSPGPDPGVTTSFLRAATALSAATAHHLAEVVTATLGEMTTSLRGAQAAVYRVTAAARPELAYVWPPRPSPTDGAAQREPPPGGAMVDCRRVMVPVRAGAAVAWIVMIDAAADAPPWSPADLQLVGAYGALLDASHRRTEPAAWAEPSLVRGFSQNVDTLIYFRPLEPGVRGFVNRAFQRVTGLGDTAWRDDPRLLLDRVHPDDRDAMEAAAAQAFRDLSGELVVDRALAPARHEVRVYDAEEREHTVSVALFAIGGPHGTAAGIGLIGEDITRFRELVDQLTDARDRAEQLSEMQREFLSHVSHELRAPLHSINGYTQLLDTTDLDARQRDFTGRVRRASAHLVQLVDDLLTLGRARVDHAMVELSDVELVEAIGQAIEMVDMSARERSMSITLDLPDDLVVRADGQRLRQVLVNLLANAIKFSAPGTAIGLVAESADMTVTLAVVDHGRGVPPDRREHLFTPFSRVSGTDVPGTGLGLVVARALCERMGGRLEHTDTPSGGATFTVTLDRH